MRREQLRFDRKLVDFLDSLNVPRTFFILGDYLEAATNEYSCDQLRAVYDPRNPLNDIQHHTYSHCVVRNIAGRKDKTPLTAEEFETDLIRAGKCLKDVLQVKATGLRMPLGYDTDFSDMPEILGVIQRQELTYVSSNLRERGSIQTSLTIQRQPHTYENAGFPNLVEIPSHGWADAIFTDDYCRRYGHEKIGSSGAADHYVSLIASAKDLSERHKLDIYVCLCLHPWAVREFDNQLDVHKQVIECLGCVGGRIITCAEISGRIREGQGRSERE